MSKAKKPKGGSEEHPEGAKMDVSQNERDRLKGLREGRGWTQQQFARRIGLTNGTISNFESGKSKQVFRTVYAKIVRALDPKHATMSESEARAHSAAFSSFVVDIADLTLEQLEALRPVVQTLKKPR